MGGEGVERGGRLGPVDSERDTTVRETGDIIPPLTVGARKNTVIQRQLWVSYRIDASQYPYSGDSPVISISWSCPIRMRDIGKLFRGYAIPHQDLMARKGRRGTQTRGSISPVGDKEETRAIE